MRSRSLSFEPPLIELSQHLTQFKAFAEAHPELDLTKGIQAVEENLADLTKQAFQNLTRWDKIWLARHEQRPQAPVYIKALFDDPIELQGDARAAVREGVPVCEANRGGPDAGLTSHQLCVSFRSPLGPRTPRTAMY